VPNYALCVNDVALSGCTVQVSVNGDGLNKERNVKRVPYFVSYLTTTTSLYIFVIFC
jgi:hypothetical protein